MAFDKVYASNEWDVPQELRPVYARAGNIAVIGGTAARVLDFRPSTDALDIDIAAGAQQLIGGLSREGLRSVRYYDEQEYSDKTYAAADDLFIGISLRNIQVVSEGDLSWQQVLEFRNDKQSVDAYRRFRYWFDLELEDKSMPFVEDAIARKLELYKDALAKHGLVARQGEIMSYLAKASALGGALLTFESLVAAAAAGIGAIFVGANVVAKIKEIQRDARAVKVSGQGAEVSFVHRIEELGADARKAPGDTPRALTDGQGDAEA